MFGAHYPRRTVGVTVCLVVLATVPAVAHAQGQSQPQPSSGEVALQSMSVARHDLAQQLGVKLAPDAPAELNVGATMTATVQEPEKLERFGLVGVQKGARLTAFRASSQRLLVEVDGLDPQPTTKRATVRIDANGRLVAP